MLRSPAIELLLTLISVAIGSPSNTIITSGAGSFSKTILASLVRRAVDGLVSYSSIGINLPPFIMKLPGEIYPGLNFFNKQRLNQLIKNCVFLFNAPKRYN